MPSSLYLPPLHAAALVSARSDLSSPFPCSSGEGKCNLRASVLRCWTCQGTVWAASVLKSKLRQQGVGPQVCEQSGYWRQRGRNERPVLGAVSVESSRQTKGWWVDFPLRTEGHREKVRKTSASKHRNFLREPQRMEFGEQEGSWEVKSRKWASG